MDWPHAPLHRFGDAGNYFITASTLHKRHLFRTRAALDELNECLFTEAEKHACRLQSWCLFSNHHHLVVASETGESVREMVRQFHTRSAIDLNRRDGTEGRRVWYESHDVFLSYPASWLARLRYTNENAVHHGLVTNARDYRWCSASWFERRAPRAFVETVRRMKTDRVNVYDDFPAALPPC